MGEQEGTHRFCLEYYLQSEIYGMEKEAGSMPLQVVDCRGESTAGILYSLP